MSLAVLLYCQFHSFKFICGVLFHIMRYFETYEEWNEELKANGGSESMVALKVIKAYPYICLVFESHT